MNNLISDKLNTYVRTCGLDHVFVLSEKQKFVLTKKIIYNLKHHEIATLLNISISAVGNIIKRSVHIMDLYLKSKSPDLLIIDSLLSSRIKNALSSIPGLITLNDLNNFPVSRLLKIPNLGKSSINDLNKYLKGLDIHLDFSSILHIPKFNQHLDASFFDKWSNRDLRSLLTMINDILNARNYI